jgi:hypothetical protein
VSRPVATFVQQWEGSWRVDLHPRRFLLGLLDSWWGMAEIKRFFRSHRPDRMHLPNRYEAEILCI